VSVGTVSNVLNRREKVAASTVERVQAAIEELGFVRNDAARQLRAGRSRSIGLLVLDVSNPFFADVARGAEERADLEHMSVLLGNSDEDPVREARYLELFQEQRVNGVLITPASAETATLTRLTESGIGVVLVDHEIPGSDFWSVAVDDVEGGYLAVAHLLAIGRRRIAFVGGPSSFAQVANRLIGARRAVDEVPGAELEVIEMPALSVLHGRAAGGGIVARAAAGRPDAIFAANDLLAVGLMQALTMRSTVRIPEDIALIGYDDIDFASSTVVPMSSIRQPARLIGYTAMELLLKSMDGADEPGERRVRFQPELVVRHSTVG
jgi:LacI family transcriptional regulator